MKYNTHKRTQHTPRSAHSVSTLVSATKQRPRRHRRRLPAEPPLPRMTLSPMQLRRSSHSMCSSSHLEPMPDHSSDMTAAPQSQQAVQPPLTLRTGQSGAAYQASSGKTGNGCLRRAGGDPEGRPAHKARWPVNGESLRSPDSPAETAMPA